MKPNRDEHREALRQLSRAELFEIEDQLLVGTELDTRYRSRFSAGRIATVVLAIAYWGLLMMAISGWSGWRTLGPLTIIPFFVTFGIALWLSNWSWRRIGMRARFIVRFGLHYWPLTIYLGAYAVIFWRGLF